MRDYPATDWQSSIDQLPSPTPRRVVDPKRPWYPSTPDNNRGKTPDPPVATTNYPTKPRPDGAA